MSHDSEIAVMWREIKAERQEKRAANTQRGAEALKEAGIQFVTKNYGSHLIVKPSSGAVVNFWPGTGLWMLRGSTQRHRGVGSLVAFCKSVRNA